MANGDQLNPAPSAPGSAGDPGSVPPPPKLEAPTQLINVRALTGRNKGSVVKIPAEKYAYFSQRGDVDLVIPTLDKEGVPHWTNARDWKTELQNGFRVDFNDREQVPLVVQLSQQLQDRDPGTLDRFVTPFWDAVKSSAPDYEKEQRKPTVGGVVVPALKESIPAIPLVYEPIKQLVGLAEKWTKAAKNYPLSTPIPPPPNSLKNMTGPFSPPGAISFAYEVGEAATSPGAGETSASAISALPVPFAPEIGQGTEAATTGNWAGALGEFALAGGMLLLQEMAPKLTGTIGKLGEKTPDILTSTKQLRNLGAQREIVAKTHEISPQLDPQDLASIRRSAGAEVKTVEKLNEEAKQFEERGKQQAAVDKANLQDVQKRGATAAEQTRRVVDLNEVNRLATEVSGAPSRPPIQQAEHVIDVVRGAQGAVNEIERAIYPYIYQQAEAAGIEVDIAPVGRRIAQETRAAIPAQTQLRAAGVSGRTLEAAAKFQAGASGTPVQIRQALGLADVGQLSSNQLDAINTLMGAMENQENLIPFSVADEAQRGLGTSIRYLRKAKATNPNLAPDLRLLESIQAQLKEQINGSFGEHHDIHSIYATAHEVTVEQHNIIDQNVIKKIFTDPRNRLTGETLVGALLKSGTEKLQGAILQALDVGPEAQQALESIRAINPEEAARITQRIADLAAPSAEAKAGLRRMVVDAAIRKGTQLSTSEGVRANNLNYNAMIQFLDADARPGAKILMGDRYEPLMRELRTKADAALRQSDPSYENFIQRETAKYEAKYEIKRTPVNPPVGSEAAMQELSEAEFVKKLTNDATFRKGAVRNASPAIRSRMVRSVIEDATQDAMVRGVPGSPDAVMDIGKWGKSIADRAQVIADIGGTPAAARELQGLGRAAERADQSASTGLVSHVYGFFTSVLTKGVRMSASIRPGVYAVGPKQIAAQIGMLEPPIELPSVPRNLDQDVFRASQDPELARMMKRALKIQPWEPGFGTSALKYYLAFAGGKTDQGKVLDDKTAQEILIRAGGKIDDAVPIAQAMGYTR